MKHTNGNLQIIKSYDVKVTLIPSWGILRHLFRVTPLGTQSAQNWSFLIAHYMQNTNGNSQPSLLEYAGKKWIDTNHLVRDQKWFFFTNKNEIFTSIIHFFWFIAFNITVFWSPWVATWYSSFAFHRTSSKLWLSYCRYSNRFCMPAQNHSHTSWSLGARLELILFLMEQLKWEGKMHWYPLSIQNLKH